MRENGAWRLGLTVGTNVPAVLERVVRSRVDRLSPAAQEVLRTASVFGTEVQLSYLTMAIEAAGALQEAMDELSSRGLMQEVPDEPKFRFRHALVQEATYQGLLREERRWRHARAATAIEAAWGGRLEEVAAVLAQHLVAAGEHAGAVGYFEIAGDHAAAAYANSEAISSFQSALAVLRQDPAGPDVAATAEVALRAKLAELYWRSSRRAEAREELEEAIRLLGRSDDVQRACLLIRLGRVEMAARCHGAAEAAFDAAGELLGERPWEQGEEIADKWLELMLDGRAQLYMQSRQPDRTLAALEAAQPVLEAQGRPARQAHYFNNRAALRARQNRHRVDEETIALIRRAAAAVARETGDEANIAWMTAGLGWTLVLAGQFDEAQRLVEGSLANAERIGDAVLRGRCLMALTVAAVRRHDADAVRSLAPRALADCSANGFATEVALCNASLAWLAWQDRRHDDVVTRAIKATDLYRTGVGTFSYLKWLGLFPLIAVHLTAARVSQATAAAREMFEPAQQWLPDDLWSTLEAACEAWDHNEPDATERRLGEALEMAHRLDYF